MNLYEALKEQQGYRDVEMLLEVTGVAKSKILLDKNTPIEDIKNKLIGKSYSQKEFLKEFGNVELVNIQYKVIDVKEKQ